MLPVHSNDLDRRLGPRLVGQKGSRIRVLVDRGRDLVVGERGSGGFRGCGGCSAGSGFRRATRLSGVTDDHAVSLGLCSVE